LGETNERLSGMEANTKVLADEVHQDRQYLDKGMATAEQLSQKVDTMNGHLAALSNSMNTLNGSVSQVPLAINQMNESVQVVGKNSGALEEQTKRLADNMGVMVVYTAVALKFAQEFVTKQTQVPAATPAPAAASPAPTEMPASATPGASTAPTPAKEPPPDSSYMASGELMKVPTPH
jgi:uncharacterized protein YoxC